MRKQWFRNKAAVFVTACVAFGMITNQVWRAGPGPNTTTCERVEEDLRRIGVYAMSQAQWETYKTQERLDVNLSDVTRAYLTLYGDRVLRQRNSPSRPSAVTPAAPSPPEPFGNTEQLPPSSTR